MSTSLCKDGTTANMDLDIDKERTPPFPVAVVGMAMRLPGGVGSETEFWDLLINKRDGLGEVPETRYNIDAFYHETNRGAIHARHGHFLQQDIAHFDHAFFETAKAEAEKMDPQQRILLEVVWECFENAGQTGHAGIGRPRTTVDGSPRPIGCYVGVFGEDWLDLQSRDLEHADRYRVIGSADFALANRVSYVYNLGGPSITLRTGCSSSLVGLHEACQALHSGECSSALVTGTNLIFTPSMTSCMSNNMVLSKSGLCRTFDAQADGYGRGEAVNAIFIKPLHDALRDGDPVRAVIRSTAINCDGRTPNITTPGVDAQERLIRAAYKKAGICDISDTAYFECHGTGTTAGDVTETCAVARVFEKSGVYIGAVKPNVGHSEGASGITSIIKSTLALEAKMIPPNVHFTEPNPKIPFEEANLLVPAEGMPWPEGKTERISINSFGIGGSNAHVILDSASLACPTKAHPTKPDKKVMPQLLLLSANSKKSLDSHIEKMRSYIQQTEDDLVDLAYTLGLRREHMKYRAFAIVHSKDDISEFRRAQCTSPRIAFVFNGQGAQWSGMGRDLIEGCTRFREDIQKMDEILQGLENGPRWSIEEELLKSDTTSRVAEAEISQPLCTAVQMALVNLLHHWGIKPTLVVGHSSGEIAAAYASGAIDVTVAIAVAYFRGQAAQCVSVPGAMLAVGLSSEQVGPYLEPGIIVACENSPQSVTLSGDEEVILRVMDRIKAEDESVLCRQLAVAVAYHSHHMSEAADRYERLIAPHLSHNESMVPLYSTVSGESVDDPSQLDAVYWSKNLRCPVLFKTAIQAIVDDDEATLFLEIGPHSTLSGPINQMIRTDGETKNAYVSTLQRGKSGLGNVLETAGRLYAHGAPIQLPVIMPRGKLVTDIPPYCWQHDERLWSESRIACDWRLRKEPHHELLGSRAPESGDLEPIWRNLLSLDNALWLLDHRVVHEVIFPCAGYIAMAGEAIRQISGSLGYTIQNLFIRAALVIKEGTPIELLTSLRPAKLADNVDSAWYEFVISAHQDGRWRKHCVGEVRPLIGDSPCGKQIQSHSYPRHVKSDVWYRQLETGGLTYGPSFKGLQHITASTSSYDAAAVIEDQQQSSYALHPISIDQSLQLFSVAMSHGLSNLLTRLCLPTAIETLHVRPSTGPLAIHACCDSVGGSIMGGATMTSGKDVVLSMHRGWFLGVPDMQSDDSQTLLVSQMWWKPDIDFLRVEDLFPQIDRSSDRAKLCARFVTVCIVEMYRRTESCVPASEHLSKYKTWIAGQYNKIRERGRDLVPEMRECCLVELGFQTPYFDRLTEDMEGEGIAWLKLCERVALAAQGIMEGAVSPIDFFMQDDAWADLYSQMVLLTDWSIFLSHLGHSKPSLRVLEIGAGTGGSTSVVLDGLTSHGNQRQYSKYTFTDISSGFLPKAKEKFKGYQGMEYRTLDISRDPQEQGFELHAYDLVIASNSLHAAANIADALKSTRKLIAPGGYLLLQEGCNVVPGIDFIMGVLPGWWTGEEEERREKPTLSPNQWNDRLFDAGFSGTDIVRLDHDAPYQFTASMLSRPQSCESGQQRASIGLLYYFDINPWGRRLERQLSSSGYSVYWHTLNQAPQPNSKIISLLDLEDAFFANMTPENFRVFQCYLSGLDKQTVLWVTHSLQMECEDPRFALALGVARTIRQEMELNFCTLEIDRMDTHATRSVLQVLEKLQNQIDCPREDPDCEYALKDGTIYVGRYEWTTFDQQLAGVPADMGTRSLDIGSPGMLDTLTWSINGIQSERLGPEEVEVDIKYVGLNFRDVMIAMGLMGSTKELGLEASAVVRRIGSAVADFKVGDQVAVLYQGLMGTRVTVPVRFCSRIPPGNSLEDAAATPCIFSTAIYSLISVGNLQAQQTVLIHSACGGVGQAAIQICQMIGAEIFATVGSKEKVQHLVEHNGIPEDHIFDSRSPSFLSGVMAMTKNRGVDIVLNSLAGELLHVSWKCVAPFGKMIELGKRDFMGHGKLDMHNFGANRAFFGVDLVSLAHESPEAMQMLGAQFYHYAAQGKLKPIRPVTVYEATDIKKAFRYMQSGQHMGKIVIRIPDQHTRLPVSQLQDGCQVYRSDAAYLLVGGLGGIGRAVATKMVQQGARHLVFLSRSSGESPQTKAFLQELESTAGCAVLVVKGDVSSHDDVCRAINSSPRPFAGIVHMAMTLKDQTLSQMTFNEWASVMPSKVQGAWNLHRAFKSTTLDFFVIIGSMAGIIGSAGQANYAAANTFLDSFVKYRQAQGLPASVIDLGLVGDIGFAAENKSPMLQHAQLSNIIVLNQQNVLKAVEIAVLASSIDAPNQLAVGLGTTGKKADIGARSIMPWDARVAGWDNIAMRPETALDGHEEGVETFISSIEKDPTWLNRPEAYQTLLVRVGRAVAPYTSSGEMDDDELGTVHVDSLVSVEVRNWIRRNLAIELSVSEMAGADTLAQLTTITMNALRTKYGVGHPESEPTASGDVVASGSENQCSADDCSAKVPPDNLEATGNDV
ncbi:putative polyketide synthase [Aspergillus campestris IBT 28561]|uniref:Polyketide synthase n=1 Tax=Aspergillus campestris (strain IBT 28561) TaxID=1392248 RepID=A0A2I1D7A2_ASPC2|nr:putative polyketide synthase [Aspergillus campestris IBT 28561]PKY05762.1 putative polyketide synthase [Aspergillus campestris IBT 28561]